MMKVLERLVLGSLTPQVRLSMEPLQFAYRPRMGVDDSVIYLLQRVRITFFDFSSAFNTMQPVTGREAAATRPLSPGPQTT